MSDEKKIRLEIEITERQAQALTRWKIPPEHCGASLESRIFYIIMESCDAIESAEARESAIRLHRMFNLRHPDDTPDDFIPF